MSIFLETKRLFLKAPELTDLDELIALRSDLEVMKYTGEGGAQTKEQVKDYLNFALAYQKKHGMGFYLVFEKDSGSFIGEAGLFHLLFDDTQSEIKVGYHLHKKYWSKGYATELTKALVHWGFQHLSINKIVASAYPNQIASQKVLQKSGFDFRGTKKTSDGAELFWYEIYQSDGIDIVPYDDKWPQMAELEIAKLREFIPDQHLIDIQHVGSTAIPGMLAKPIIDIQIVVDSLLNIKKIAVEALENIGYVYWREDPDPEKMFFVKGMPPFGDKRTHHVHIIEPHSKRGQHRIIFRDYLIAHPEAAQEYGQLKIKLSQQYTYDREQYTDAKTQFINEILKKAGDKQFDAMVVIVETKHLQLRRPTTADLLILRTLWQDEKVRQFLGGTISHEIIDEKISLLQKHWEQYGFGQCSVIDKKYKQVIGICGIYNSEDGLELSYMFFPSSWGKGLAKEAALGSLDYGFNNLQLEKIIAIPQGNRVLN